MWHNNGTNTLNLGTSNPRDRNSVFYDSSWITPNRTASLEESSIAPGEVGTFDFAIHSPVGATSSNEYFQPVLEGQAWLDDIGLYWSITTR